MNLLTVHQDFNPTSGGGSTFQESILNELKSLNSRQFRIFTARESIVNPGSSKRIVEQYNIDLVWYLFPTKNLFPVPYISTVWDLAHRAFPIFPEVTHEGSTFGHREEIYRSLLSSFRIVTGTEKLKTRLQSAYGFEEERIIVNPFPVPGFTLITNVTGQEQPEEVDQNVRILFYPAQFWPHKNHLTLIRALGLLIRMNKDSGVIYQLHFTGSDKGNESFVRQQAESLGLMGNIVFHGFVTQKELLSHYDRAFALVYPSLFGPDNLPPLEAMARGCPVATADIEGAREVYADGVVYFNPLDPSSIANSIMAIADEAIRTRITVRGKYLASQRSVATYMKTILDQVSKFSACRALYS